MKKIKKGILFLVAAYMVLTLILSNFSVFAYGNNGNETLLNDDVSTSNEGEAMTEEEFELLKAQIATTITNNKSGSNWGFVDTGYETSGFSYAYCYKKSQGVGTEPGKLSISGDGLLNITFDVFVSSATNGNFELQIDGGASFAYVKDSEGNALTPVGNAIKPYVTLNQGQVYSVKLDLTKVTNSAYIMVWTSKAVTLYYSNFVFETGYKPAPITAQQSILCDGNNLGYFAWPSVENIGGDRLIAVSSGYRSGHHSYDGKVVGWISENNGESWSEPFIIADTILDDRDSGVIYWRGKIIVTWFTRSVKMTESGWPNNLTDEETKNLGANYVVSEDGGRTWSEPELLPVFSPHGFIEGPDGELVYVGYSDYSIAEHRFTKMGMITSTDGKNWSDVKVIADYKEKLAYGFDEPHAVFNDDGRLIVQLRTTADGIYQCESDDYGESFTDFHLICDAKDTPPHLLKLDDGTLLLTYGARSAPYGIRARLSYDGGVTWTNEYIITSDAPSADMGYPDTVVLSNGKMLSVYYQRIKATDTNTSILQVIWTLPEKPVDMTMTISFNSMGGSEVKAISGKFGTPATAPAIPTRKGYAFAGWYTDSKYLQKYTFSIFSDTITLYAKWEAVESPKTVPQVLTSSYLRAATAEELANAGYTGTSDTYFYTKPKGIPAANGNQAEIWVAANRKLGNKLTFSFYIQDWLTTDEIIVEIDCIKDASLKLTSVTAVKQSDSSIPYINQANTRHYITMETKTWYTVTVDLTDCDKMNIVAWASRGMNAIITDVEITDDCEHNYNAVVTKPTCVAQGYTTYTCTICENSYIDNYTDVVHTYGDWEVVNSPKPGVDGLKQKVCSSCGKTVTKATPAMIELSFKSASLVLQSNLAFNFKVDSALFADGAYENPYVVFVFDGKEVVVDTYTVDGDKYVFTLYGITPDKMNDTVNATLYAEFEGEVFTATKAYSVKEYCYNMLEQYADNESLRTLVVDLLNYGAASQEYSGYNTENLANADLTAQQSAWGTADVTINNVFNAKYEVIDNASVTWKGAGVTLLESVALRFKFRAESTEDLTVNIRTADSEWNFSGEDIIKSGDCYYVLFDKLGANEMSEEVYITVMKDGEAVSNTACYSIESYAYAKQNADATLANLVKAMMRYGNSAKNYK